MKKMIIGTGVFTIFIFVLIFGAILMVDDEEENKNSKPKIDVSNLSPEVLKHFPMVKKYCKEFEIEEYVNYILAIIQVESGGTAEDVMQSSESLGLPPNSLSTKESIEQGVKYFSGLIKRAERKGCDIDSALQSYNYGGGFLDYVERHGRKYTFALAESFSKDMANGEKTDYHNPIAVSTNGGWRYTYGNMFYVQLVKQYLNQSIGENGFMWPVPSYYGKDWITSTFGGRYNPVSGIWENAHGAIDIGAPGGTPIYAAADGTVLLSEFHSSYGNFVKIWHDDTYSTLYAHASKLLVAEGQTVKQGDTIAYVGSTGDSTGNHLHFEVRKNDEKVDPMQFF